MGRSQPWPDIVSESGAAMIWCPFGDEESAARVAGDLLEEGLVACANILAPMRSIFRWQGERGEAIEHGVIFKTERARAGAAMERLAELHPYDTPAILAWDCDATPVTEKWLAGGGE